MTALATYHEQHNDQLGLSKARLYRIATLNQPENLIYHFIEEMLAQLYYKYKETGIMISFCPDTNINFDEFMFTTDLFAIQEDNEDYIFERISGQRRNILSYLQY